jgi:hypothetical protein
MSPYLKRRKKKKKERKCKTKVLLTIMHISATYLLGKANVAI